MPASAALMALLLFFSKTYPREATLQNGGMIEPGGTGHEPLIKCLYSYDCTMTDPSPKVSKALEQGHGMYLSSYPLPTPSSFLSSHFPFQSTNTSSVAGLQGLCPSFLPPSCEIYDLSRETMFRTIWDCLGTERWESKVHRRGLKARLDRSSVSQMRGGAREHPDISSSTYIFSFFFFFSFVSFFFFFWSFLVLGF